MGETLNGTDFWSDRAVNNGDLMANLGLMAPKTGAIGTDFWSGQNARIGIRDSLGGNNTSNNTKSNTQKVRRHLVYGELSHRLSNKRNNIVLVVSKP